MSEEPRMLTQLPPFTFRLLPTVSGKPFIVRSISRFAPRIVTHARLATASKGGL